MVAVARPKPLVKARTTWGTSDRFDAGSGWTREKARDEARFALLAGNDEDGDGNGSVNGSQAGTQLANQPRPDGRSRFVVTRPENSLSVKRSPPGTIASHMTTADGIGLSQSVLKVPGKFYIQPRDMDGNPVAASLADVFRIHIVGLETPTHSVVEEDDGRIAVRWLPSVSGDFKLIVTINGVHIKKSPFIAASAQGEITASFCRVVDVPPRVGVGAVAEWAIEARDQMGNLAAYPPLTNSRYAFRVMVDGPHETQPIAADEGEDGEDGGRPPSVPKAPVATLTPLHAGYAHVSLPLTVVGKYFVSVLGEDGTLVGGESYPIVVEPTALSAKHCTLSGKGLSQALAGKESDFRMRALDKHGNACEVMPPHASAQNFGFDVKLKFVASPPAPAHAPDGSLVKFAKANRFVESAGLTEGYVAMRGIGRFTSSYSLTRAGAYQLAVSYGGVPVPHSPWGLTVRPGATHARSCVRLEELDEAAPLRPCAAGRKASFLLLARDYFGNVRQCGGDNIHAQLRGTDRHDCEVVDYGDGVYEIIYTPQSAGEYMCAVSLRTEPVLGSPFTLRVLPADTNGYFCVASGNNLALGDCGTRHSVMIEARDAHGNPRGFGGDHVEAYILGPLSAEHPTRYECHARDCEDGWYEVTYQIDVIGKYKLHLLLNDAELKQSPEALTVTGGRTYPPACVRLGSRPGDKNLPVGSAGAPYCFTIEARDDFHEPRGFGGDPFLCVVSGGPDRHSKTPATVEDQTDGTYEVCFTPEHAGAYLIAVTLRGEHIAGSRFALEVKPSSAHAPSCVGSGSGLRGALAGARARFAVQTWDAHGNVCNPPLSSFRVRLVCDGSPIVVVPKGVDVGNGRYTFTYSTEVAGVYLAHVLIATRVQKPGGAFSGKANIKYEPMHIAGSPFTVVVKPAATYPPACGVRWVAPAGLGQSLTVGHPVQLAIQSRDRFFNARDEGGDKFTITLKSIIPPPKTAAERSDQHALAARDGRRQGDRPPPPLKIVGASVDDPSGVPGLYLASAMATLAGDYRVILGLEGLGAADEDEAEEGGEEDAPELTAEELRLAEEATAADLEAEAQAEAEAEAIRRQQNGAPPEPKLSIATLAVLMGRIRAWKARGALAAIANRRKTKRIFTANVVYTADVTDPSTCVVSGEGLWRPRAHERGTWTIQPRDRFSNATVEPSSAFGVLVVPAPSGDGDGDASGRAHAAVRPLPGGYVQADGFASVTMSSGALGSSVVSWLWWTSGKFHVHVWLGGVKLAGSPYLCEVGQVYSGEPIRTMPQRQSTLNVFHSGAANSWQEESAAIWERERGDMHEYVARGLTHPAGPPLALGSDVARTWQLQQLDPATYHASQALETDMGVAGKRGRYGHRKRGALLHFRLAAMSHELAAGGVSMPKPDLSVPAAAGGGGGADGAPEPPLDDAAAADVAAAGGDPMPGLGYTYGYGGAMMRLNAPDAMPTSMAAPSPRLAIGGASRDAKKEKTAEGWRKLRGMRTARRLARDKQIAPPHSWRVLGPEPQPPAEPLPSTLTPRAAALAQQLEQLELLGATV